MDAIRPICLSLLFCYAVFLAIWLVMKNALLSSFITFLILLLFFTYGHVYDLLYTYQIAGIRLARNSILLSIFFLFFCIALVQFIRNKSLLIKLTPYINIVSATLFIFPAIKILDYSISRFNLLPSDINPKNDGAQLIAPEENYNPDIYLIVLDGYNRQDVLAGDFGFDNSDFIDELKNLGFYVAECSRGNYDHTNVALTSELNLDYMQNLIPDTFSGDYEARVASLFEKNVVIEELKRAGYEIYQFNNSTYPWLNWSEVNSLKHAEENNVFTKSITPFEMMFLNTTAIKIFSLHFPEFFEAEKKVEISRFDQKIHQELFILDSLPSLAAKSSPKFVNAHILITHTPFVFTKNGEMLDAKFREYPLSEELYREGYINQTIFLNNRLLPILKSLIQDSEDPPIIILQSDHGNKNDIGNKVNRPNQILNAYYFPNDQATAYSNITPVNTFRLIFNSYFSTNFPLLDDISYKVTDLDNYTFEEVGETYIRCK